MSGRPRSVLHLVETLARGGAERMVVDLAIEQRSRGLDAAIACLFSSGILAAEAQAGGVPVHVLGKQPGIDLAVTRRLRRLAADFAVVHTHNAVANYYAALANLPTRRWRQVSTRHGMGNSAAVDRRERLYRASLARTDAVVCVCEAARTAFAAAGVIPAARSIVIPNGIRVERFAPAEGDHARARARELLGVPATAYVVGIVGRLNWAKDHSLLLAAFAAVRRDCATAELCVVGDGELRERLHAEAATLGLGAAVHWLGDRSDVPALLPGMDTFVLSSRTEGYSMALLEAASAGVALVATDVGGNREIVRDGETGRLVPHGDVAALAAALLEQADPAVAGARARAAQRWALAEATTSAMAARYELAYRDAAPRAFAEVA